MKILLLFTLFCLTLYYIPGTGGSGVALPYNLTLIVWLGLVMILLAWRHKKDAFKGTQQPLLVAGGTLLLLPWLLQANGNTGVWVLFAALLLWQLLLHLRFTPQHKQFVLFMILILALGQATIGLLQVFAPHLAARIYEYDWLHNHGRPYGIFQQVNLLASFLASGLGCGFLLLVTRRKGIWWIIPVSGLLVLLLTLIQSRAGLIGAAAIIISLAATVGRRYPKRTGWALVIMVLCAGLGTWVTQHMTVLVNGEPYLLARSYESSTHERWMILKMTWQMVMQHPWLGWGYGTFEYAFSRYAMAHPEFNYTYPKIVTHPHNELLYAWFQGGITALAGMLLLFIGWLVMIFKGFKTRRITGAYALLILPLLVHLCHEYPFYQSFLHFGLFIVLLRLGIVEQNAPEEETCTMSVSPRLLCGLCGLCLVAFSVTGLYVNHQLTTLERARFEGYPTPAPWYFAVQGERAEFDEMVALLMNYNHHSDPKKLEQFMVWANRWSARHNDKNIWHSMIMIEQYRGHSTQVAAMKKQYQLLFHESE